MKKKFFVIKGSQCGVNIDPADQVGLWYFTPAIVSAHNQVIKQARWHSCMEKVNICLQKSKGPKAVKLLVKQVEYCSDKVRRNSCLLKIADLQTQI